VVCTHNSQGVLMRFRPILLVIVGFAIGGLALMPAHAAVSSTVNVTEQAGLISAINPDDFSPYKTEDLAASSSCVGCQARIEDTRNLISATTEYVHGLSGGGLVNGRALSAIDHEPTPVTVTRDFGQITTQAWSRATHGSLSTSIHLSTSPQPVQAADGYAQSYLGATVTSSATFSDTLTIRAVMTGGFPGIGIARFKGRLLETFEGTPQERNLRLTMSASVTGTSLSRQTMTFDKQVIGPLTDYPEIPMASFGQVQRTGTTVSTYSPIPTTTDTFLHLGDDNSVYLDVVFRNGAPITISSTLSVFFDAISADSSHDMQSNYSVNTWWDGIESVHSYNQVTGQIGPAAHSFTVTAPSLIAWNQSQYTPLVPEPSTVALALTGALALCVSAKVRARRVINRPETAGA
jgi:hypothetical protein